MSELYRHYGGPNGPYGRKPQPAPSWRKQQQLTPSGPRIVPVLTFTPSEHQQLVLVLRKHADEIRRRLGRGHADARTTEDR